MEFCSMHGFGFLLTDGKHTPEHLLKGKVNRRLEKELKAVLDTNPIRGEQYRSIKEHSEATPSQLYRAIIRLGLDRSTLSWGIWRVFHGVAECYPPVSRGGCRGSGGRSPHQQQPATAAIARYSDSGEAC